MSTHSLNCAIYVRSGCRHDISQITHCVICEARLQQMRTHVDTCGGRCFARLLKLQRTEAKAEEHRAAFIARGFTAADEEVDNGEGA